MDLLKPRGRARTAALWFGAFTILGLLLSAQDAVNVRVWGGSQDIAQILESRLMQAYVTLFSSVLAWWAARIVRTAPMGWGLRLSAYAMVFVAYAAVSVLLASASRFLVDEDLYNAYTFGDVVLASFERSVSFMGLMYTVVILGESLAGSLAAEHQRALENVELLGRLSEARLETLRLQLQPHFLFNTLHAASALVETKPASARRILVDLGDLLRASLDKASEHEVSLRHELDLLDRYLDIQRIRFGDRLTFKVTVPEDCLGLGLPAMLLQPLVENAIRHGVGDKPGPGEVRIECATVGTELRITITDDGLGLAEGVFREGVGLGNTRARLAGLYGSQGAIDIEANSGGGTIVSLRLPARPFKNFVQKNDLASV